MEKATKTPLLIDSLFQKALHSHQMGDNDTTIDLLETVLQIAEQNGQCHPQAQVMLAHQLRQRGDWERAQVLYQDTLRRIRPLDIDDDERDKVLGQVFLGLGRVFEMQHKMQAARAAWKRGLGFFRRGGHAQWTQLMEYLLDQRYQASTDKREASA